MTNSPLSQMEEVLLTSLQNSQTEHEKRLVALEQLLKQLTQQSSEDSATAKNAFDALREQLDQLSAKLTSLDAKLTKWTPFWIELDARLKASQAILQDQAKAYHHAKETFNSMRQSYVLLASEVEHLRGLAAN